MTEEEKIYENCRKWLDEQPEAEGLSLRETDRVASTLIGIAHKYDKLRVACQLADDKDIELLPLYCRFMDYRENGGTEAYRRGWLAGQQAAVDAHNRREQ